MWLSRAALPHLKASGDGRIVGISSLIGNHAWLAGLDAYAASKAGMNGIARSLAIEFAQYGATVNVIEPGLVISHPSPLMHATTRRMILPNIPVTRAVLPR